MAENTQVRKKKKRRKKHYLLRFIVFIGILVGLYSFMVSDFFDIDEIVVENNSYYTAEQIIDRSGIKTGGNIFKDIGLSAAEDVLMEDPYIRNAQIMRKYPNQVIINVAERTEAAAIPYATSYILIDTEGLVLRTSEVEPKLPLILGLTIKEMNPGAALEVEENSILNDTLEMIKAIEESDVYFKKIDISNVMVKAYVYDALICQGMPQDIIARVKDGTLQGILYELYESGIERGTVTVTSDPTNMAFGPDYE